MIKTLNNTIKQDRTVYKIPRSVQDVIPIQRIFADGIFQFGTKYSRTLRFSDINYSAPCKAVSRIFDAGTQCHDFRFLIYENLNIGGFRELVQASAIYIEFVIVEGHRRLMQMRKEFSADDLKTLKIKIRAHVNDFIICA